MITNTRGCVTCNDLWPWPISSRSFSHNFAIKLLKYGTPCPVCSRACTDLDESFPYFAQVITNMRGCVACNNIWAWPITSGPNLTFIFKVIKLWHCLFYGLYSHVAQIQPMKGRCVTHSFLVNRSKVRVTQVVRIFAVRSGAILVDYWYKISSSYRLFTLPSVFTVIQYIYNWWILINFSKLTFLSKLFLTILYVFSFCCIS